MSRIQRLLLLILLLLSAFWLRIYRLEGQSLWWDEGISLHLATSSFAEITANRVGNIHPPLYFFLLKIWVSLTGTTPFAARYLSVLASFLQVPLVYAVLCRWLGRKTAVIGLLLTAVWSLSIIYAQEVRVYAFLPLIYLALLLLTQQIVTGTITLSHKNWLWLAVLEWVGLHLHYNILFLIIFLNGWALLRLWRQQRLRTWIKTQFIVFLASLPWAIAVLLNRSTIQTQTNLVSFATDPPAWSFIIPQVWGFHLTGLVNVLTDPLLRVLNLSLILLIALLLAWGWSRPRRWSQTLLLFWLGPLWLGASVWLLRSSSHPRYISQFAPGFILLLAYLLSFPLSRSKNALGSILIYGLRLAVVLCFLWLSSWGLWHYYFDRTYAKNDMREVSQILLAQADSNDLILVPRTDWSLPVIYSGNTPVQMVDTLHEAQLWADLARWTMPSSAVFTLDYANKFYDWQQIVPFALESAGSLVQRWQVDALILSQYQLTKPVTAPLLLPRDGRFGSVALLGSWVEPTTTTADGVTVALRWRLLSPVTQNYSVVLAVDDGTGLDLAVVDDQLVNANGRLTTRWQVGDEVTTYHFLPFIAGTPPLNYEVALRVYIVQGEVQTLDYINGQGVPMGQNLAIGDVEVKRPLPGQTNLYGVVDPRLPLPEPLLLTDGLLLTYANPDRSFLAPGQRFLVRLRWQTTAELPDIRPRLLLWQDGQELAANDEAPALGQYPTNLWQAGDVVLEQRPLLVPATAMPGSATLLVELDGRRYPLAEVNILAEAHNFEPPNPQVPLDVTFGNVARLVGFDPPPANLSAGEPVPLTLYWRSLTTWEPIAYTVFTQVLDENGRLIAQHDAPPANGSRPTTGWLANEFISDAHLLTFREPDYVGTGQIVVGLYDPVTGGRLQTADGVDHIVLPIDLKIR